MGSAHRGCRRLDAWAMRKSWSPWTTIGYEIKVDRGDFLRDDKWHEYRDVCHEMYFVCPWKLIQVEELPAEVGLLWVNKGGKAVTKRKAVRRDPDSDKLLQLMSYVLMSRSRIVADMWEANGRGPLSADDWRAWLEGRAEHHQIGHLVRKAIRKQVGEVEERALEVDCENKRLKKLEDKLRSIGLDPDECSSWNIESKIDELRGAVPRNLTRDMRRAAQSAIDAANELDRWMSKCHKVDWHGTFRGTESNPRETGYCQTCRKEIHDGDGMHTR